MITQKQHKQRAQCSPQVVHIEEDEVGLGGRLGKGAGECAEHHSDLGGRNHAMRKRRERDEGAHFGSGFGFACLGYCGNFLETKLVNMTRIQNCCICIIKKSTRTMQVVAHYLQDR